MAPRKASTNAPAAAAKPASESATVGGYFVQIIGFIPVSPKDLRKQAEIPMLLLDVSEGKKTIADLAPMMENVTYRQQFTRKRFDKAIAQRMLGQVPAQAPEPQGDGDEGEAGEGEE